MSPLFYMIIKATKDFSSTVLGNIAGGKTMEVADGYARHLIEHGYVERVTGSPKEYQTKVETPVPLADCGRGVQYGVSEQAPASPQKTRKGSKVKQSSRSTTASD
jgi:hypothetical protein